MRSEKRGLRRGERGVAFVETAVSFLPALALVVLTMDMFRFSYQAALVQFVASNGVRIANTDSSTSGRKTNIENDIIQFANNFGMKITAADIHLCAASDVDCSGESDGGPGELISVRVHYDVPMIWSAFMGQSFTVEGLAVGRNEPYL